MNACPECGSTEIRRHAEGCKVETWIKRHLETAPPLSRATIRRVVNLLGGPR